MRSLFFGFLFFTLYSVGARYYYVCKIKQNCSDEIMSIQAANEIPHTLSLVYNDSMLLSEYEQFKFEYGSIVPKSLTNNNMDFLIETASFLKDNPKTNLEITGHMRATEKDMTPEYGKNIADARAIKIRAQLIRNGIPEKRILTKHATYDGKVLLEPVTFEVKDK